MTKIRWAATAAAVCLTGVGLLRVVISLKTTDTLADDLLCLDAVIFLFATISAYWACARAACGGCSAWNSLPT